MEDYLQPLKGVKDKVRGLTGISWDVNFPEENELQTRFSCNNSDFISSSLARCSEDGLMLEKVKLIQQRPLVQEKENQKQEVLLIEDPRLTNNTLPKAINGRSYFDAEQNLEPCDKNEYLREESPQTVSPVSPDATFELVEAVLDGEVQNGIALVRSFHGVGIKEDINTADRVALTLKRTLQQRNHVKKILVAAWDVQQSLGIQQAFYEDPRVLYFSVGEKNVSGASAFDIGEKLGRGYNINLSYGNDGLSDTDYLSVLYHLLLPMAYEYNPDLVLICIGGDKKNGALFAHLTTTLMSLALGKVAVILESGNREEYLPEAAVVTLRALTGQPCSSLLSSGAASESIRKAILDVLNVQRPYWKCLRFQKTEETQSPAGSLLDEERLSALSKRSLRKDDAKKATSLHAPSGRVALIYDERMLAHYSYTAPNHVERPERIYSIYNRMLEYGLVDRCHRIEAQMASKEQIVMLHEPSYVDLISRVQSDEEIGPHLFRGMIDTVSCCPDTYALSLLAAGSSIKLVDAILDGETDSGIAVIRPPGHHAEAGAACGFCLFNNTALAAKHAIEERNLARVLIVDWDVHHGNGIQRMFLEDPRVLYISTHLFDDFPVLPETMGSNVVGEGAGLGFNVNIPWSQREMGDSEYLSAFFDIILPLASEFQPELVLVACGFDAARGDPLGGCNISPETYGHMTHFLKPLANGRMAVILEGGYGLESVSYGMTMVAKALLGDPLPKLRLSALPHPGAREDIRRVKRAHEPYWRCLQFQIPLPTTLPVESKRWVEPQTLKWCPHLDCLMPLDPRSNKGIGFGKHCTVCKFFMPNACCLTCYQPFCFPPGNNGHSHQHYEETGHSLALHYGNLKVWCHRCDNYVDHPDFETVNKRAHWERYGENPCSYPKLAP